MTCMRFLIACLMFAFFSFSPASAQEDAALKERIAIVKSKTKESKAKAKEAIKFTKRSLANAKRGKVLGRYDSSDGRGNRTFRSRESKKAAIEDAEAMYQAAKKRYAEFKAGRKLSYGRLLGRELKVGSFGKIRQGRVDQVIDGKSALVNVSFTAMGALGPYSFDKDFYAVYPTEGLIDRSGFEPDEVFEVTGTKTYPTASGSQRTIFVIEVMDTKEIEDSLLKKAKPKKNK